MLNTGIASAISLRTRGSLSFTTNDYSHCSNRRTPFAYSSSTPWCSCCCNSIYTVPSCPNYGYNLYGLKQSSLIQWSCFRRPISSSFNYYARLPGCDIDRICYCDKVCNFRERSVGRRSVGLKKRFVYEERSEMYDLGAVDEAEAVLSLLTEDLGEEYFLAAKETRRLVKKPVVEKRENGDLCRECGSKKNRVDVGLSESEIGRECESVVSSRKDASRRRKERIRSENGQAILREEHKGSSLKNLREEREKEEREALLRKASQKSEEKQERELMRKENWKLGSRTEEKEELLRREHWQTMRRDRSRAEEREESLRREEHRQMVRKDRSRTEEKEELLRKEEHRQKMRKDGSSCSSYYSFSSNGDYDSGNEVQLTEGNYLENTSTGLKSYSTNNELVYQDTREEDQRREDYREDHGLSLANRSSSKEFHIGSGVVEGDFRKKSEKRLADISVEDMESRKETSLNESKSRMTYERNHEKSSDYVSYGDRREKPTKSMKFDEERKQQLRQTGAEVSRQSETMLKYKQFVGSQDIRSGNVIDTTGSQKVYTRKGEMSAKVACSNQELSSREDEHHRNSRKVSEESEIQDIDIRKTSNSQQRFETSVKREDYSNPILGSIDNAEHQQQYDRVSGQVELRRKSQKLIEKDNKSMLRRETDEFAKQEESVNLTSTSSSESKEPHSLIHAKITRSGTSRNESDELNKVIVTHSGNTCVIWVEDRNKNATETAVIPPLDSPEIATFLGSTTGIAIDDDDNGRLQLESTTLHGSGIQGSVAIHPEAYSGAKSYISHGQPSRFISDKDAIESAARLEKSSTHYVSEFVEQVRSEILSSEIQREKEIYRTKILHEGGSGDAHSNEHDLVHGNQQSGAKGPSDEMWNVDELSIQEPSKPEVQDNASKDSDVIVKRTGRSLWNIIADIARLRWSAHSESHDSGKKTGGRTSSIQSASSEKWFSGHEAEENEEALQEKEGRSSKQGLSDSYQQGQTSSQIEESSSSSSLESRLRHVGINAPSSSVTQERSSLQASISLPSGGEISGDTPSAAIIDSSVPLPALRLQRSPAVRGVPEAEEAAASGSGMSEQVNTGLVEQTQPVVNEGEVKQKKLQRKDQVVRDRFDEWEEAYRIEAEQRKIDEMFMREALLEAQKAADNWEVPVGAVLVHNGKIIARGCNLVEELRDSTAHAEIICIREASNILRTWRLSETTLYVTLEPCPMCAGAILQARVDTLVWGAPNKLLGADGSWIRLFPGDGGNGAEASDKPAAPVHPFHPKMNIRRGVLALECADAMQQFFKRRRKKEKKADTSPKPQPSCIPISNRPSNFMAKMHDAFHLMFCL
ncbi:hypothetical protein C2S52_020412 [Perilla frutescens var. hirtella]|nr:hypothetical protein C2S52_020412 [Perilla frutescens var. hirtella]